MTSSPTRVALPGQAHVDDGPIDHTGMHLMHHAFRRDLGALVTAAAVTPPDDVATWRALSSYWQFVAGVLHHHHTVEDDHYWPALTSAVRRRGTPTDQATIAAMADEHALVDPALRRCRTGFERAIDRPHAAAATDLHERLVELRDLTVAHMAHEESEALPLVSRVMTQAEYARVEKAIARAYPVRLVPKLVPWAVHGLPPEAERAVLSEVGAPHRAVLRMSRGRFARWRERAVGGGDG